jgi:hypothetical protein
LALIFINGCFMRLCAYLSQRLVYIQRQDTCLPACLEDMEFHYQPPSQPAMQSMHFDDAILASLFMTTEAACPVATTSSKRVRSDDVSPATTTRDDEVAEPTILTTPVVGSKRPRRDESASTTTSGSDDETDGYDSLTVKQLHAIKARMTIKLQKMVAAIPV